jgi:hypothetical protein
VLKVSFLVLPINRRIYSYVAGYNIMARKTHSEIHVSGGEVPVGVMAGASLSFCCFLCRTSLPVGKRVCLRVFRILLKMIRLNFKLRF